MKKTLIKAFKKEIPDLTGFIEIKIMKGTAIIAGRISTDDEDALEKISAIAAKTYPGTMFIHSIEVDNGLTVVADENIETTTPETDTLDEVKIVFMGQLPINAITPNDEFKILHKENLTKVDDVVKVLDFIAPIILDSDLKVIDGNLRLEVAKNNKMRKVPVVVINDNGKRADFLRMSLNRSSEFQRWLYADIDNFVDTNPQVQPIAEPLGFFGKLLLPTTFFSNTVVNYRIDEYNEQQKKYRQEMGIAAWAELQRKRNEAEIEAKKPRKEKKKNAVSLFDLVPKKEDFLETYDIEEDIKAHEGKMRELAATITENYDEERKPQLMEQGRWQGTRRTSTEKAADLRAEAEAALLSSEEEALVTGGGASGAEADKAGVSELVKKTSKTKKEESTPMTEQTEEVSKKEDAGTLEDFDSTFDAEFSKLPKKAKPAKSTKKAKPAKKETQKEVKKSLAELMEEQKKAQEETLAKFSAEVEDGPVTLDDLF